MLIEIHMLQNHAPSNLNRDDTGSPKECVFGGVRRARISSQCLKRTIRRSEMFRQALVGHLATRTRRLPEIVEARLKAADLSAELAAVAAKKASGFGTRDGKEQDKLETAQTMFLTERDIDAVTEVLRQEAEKVKTPAALEKVAAKDLQLAAQQKGFRPVTVDIALFGRMTTSGAFRDAEASAQVAHALSTHKVDHEFDYFTAVDDLMDRAAEEEQDAGADMIGDVEYNSACYYKYFAIDLPGLIANLTGEATGRKREDVTAGERESAAKLAGEAIEAVLRAAALCTPTGKQNSFAAHQLPAAILVEVRPHKTPVSYANAFVMPVTRRDGEGDLVRASLDRLSKHVKAVTDGFNLESQKRLLLAPEHGAIEIDGVERVKDLNALCAGVREAARD